MQTRTAVVWSLVALLLVAYLMRPRGVAPETAATPVEGAVWELPPPPDLRKPTARDDRVVRSGHEARGEPLPDGVAELAPPPRDPALTEAGDGEAAVERSAWPLDRDGLMGAVEEAHPQLAECYEGWLVENPELAGKIVMSLHIEDVDGIGTVTAADVVEETTGHGAFESCVTSVMAELQFDPPANGGSLEVTWPFLFAQAE